jgi:ribosomal protein S18 acetylase RimI-like enzyme
MLELPLVYRAAQPADAEAMVDLIRRGFDPSLLGAFVYGCDGAAAYVAEQVRASSREGDTAFFVATQDDRVVGMIEMRLLHEELFLNYVAVHPSVRRHHVGSRLLGHAIEVLGTTRHRRLSLDVLESNLPASRWYDGLGFHEISRTCWYVGPIPAPAKEPESGTTVSGMPQANACHAAFGFSMVTVTTGKKSYSIGLLGRTYFRVTSAEPLEDDDLLGALTRLDGSRQILALLPSGVLVPKGLTPLAVTRRLTVELVTLTRSLESETRPS